MADHSPIIDRARSGATRALSVAGHLASRAAARLENSGGLTLQGDRWVEWSFCFARLSDGPGTTLDFGADIGFLSLAAAQKGHEVVALDRMPAALDYAHPRVQHIQADILDEPLRGRRFDQIVNCSSIEHVGLAGRYGSASDANGDLRAMGVLHDLLSDDGRHILTVPVGRDMTCAPLHRIYGEDRLPRLLERHRVVEEQYWIKDPGRAVWVQGDRDAALTTTGSERFYSLGLFVLSPARP
jgi:Caenorhabditis protein of unknown function, DUF268